MGGTGVIDQFLENFTRYIDSGFGLLSGEVGYLATTLAAIDLTLAGLFWSFGPDEDVLARLVKKTLFVGIFAFITGIRSDLPGQITAQVTEAVYDSPTGRARLIPQGARLIGTYDSQVAFGQSRVLLIWTRLIMPDGRSIVLERQPGADAAGYSGLEDEVVNHWKELFGAAALTTLLAVGTDVNSGADTGSTNSDLIAALRRGAGDSINQTGQQVVRRNLNIQPTLTIRPGFPVRVIVNRDLVLEPYRGR
ncbi:TrbI/VirB10 family protein [Bradyrhizobium murdochi]|uniref:TrbI/VirB10 family protein n=1 Tax=Bradyrhizobium murdochi TaxID=1038859 RepID=UPI0004022536